MLKFNDKTYENGIETEYLKLANEVKQTRIEKEKLELK